MKRIAFLTAMVFLLAFQPFTAFADDIKGHRLEKEMREMASLNIMRGYTNGNFGPDDEVTRGQFALLIFRALNLPDPGGSVQFLDVLDEEKDEDTELEIAVRSAFAAGIINGYNEFEFKPSLNIERQQMAAMIHRALQFKEVEGIKLPLTFTDSNLIAASFLDAVAYNTYFEIIQGHTDGRFAPTDSATRAHAAAFIYRLLNVIEREEQRVLFEIGSIKENGEIEYESTKYQTFTEAALAFDPTKHEIISIDNKVIKMKEGIAYTRPSVGATVTIYNQSFRDSLTYLPRDTEMKYLDSDGTIAKVQIADTIGYVLVNDLELVPKKKLKGQSYYRNIDGKLFHYVYVPNTNHYQNYSMGPAPEFIVPGDTKYYSWNGYEFYDAAVNFVGEHYNYFNYLPLRTKTTYTAEQLNQFVKEMTPLHLPESPLQELGEVFIAVQEEYNINGLYLLAKAIHESAWGTSKIANEKKNLFGLKAFDSNPVESAKEYETYEDSIRDVANFINELYISPFDTKLLKNWRYNGPLLGNKTVGFNVRYASDPYWGQKIAGHMYRADRYLGGFDTNIENSYHYGIIDTEQGLNVRSAPVINPLNIQFTYPKIKGISVLIVDEEIDANGDTWYKIVSDHPSHEFAYVYGYGSLGEYIKVVNPSAAPAEAVEQ